MIMHSANRFSWYPVSFHPWVADPRLYNIDLGEGVEMRYDLKKAKSIVVLSEKIEKSPEKKKAKVKELKEILKDIKMKDSKELEKEILSINKLIIKVVNK